MTMKKHMVSHNVHIAAAAALVCFLQGCDGCGRKPQPEKPDPVVERVSDKEYMGRLGKCVEEQRKLARTASDTIARLDAARASGAAAETVAAISNELQKCYRDMEAARRRAQEMVRDRMLQQNRGSMNKEAK